jgi:putative ABC transport system substrate-binding protein
MWLPRWDDNPGRGLSARWHAGNEDEEREYFDVLAKSFESVRYVDGPAERLERFNILARELVDAEPDVIVAVNIRAAAALKRHTQSIPVVVVLVADPVGDKLVESLAHPGGNMTGLSLMLKDMSGKRVSVLKEAVPRLKRLALIAYPADLIHFG